MPYRLRIFRNDLLVATDNETPEDAGRRFAEYPLEELTDESEQVSIRREVVYRDEKGERPATREEEDRIFKATAERQGELGEAAVAPCPRCGRKRAEHEEPLYPVRLTPEGPIYFACWTPEERTDLLS